MNYAYNCLRILCMYGTFLGTAMVIRIISIIAMMILIAIRPTQTEMELVGCNKYVLRKSTSLMDNFFKVTSVTMTKTTMV